ncbi:glycosyltransferase family 20-domain-containing protein [Suillus lakei]|nr:glycosyltransferase family 20-domain-containing protein [Suillus lakei]
MAHLIIHCASTNHNTCTSITPPSNHFIQYVQPSPTPTLNTPLAKGQPSIHKQPCQHSPTTRPHLGPRLASPLIVPRMLRNATHSGALSSMGGESDGGVIICLFVHTPFPSSEAFRCLPCHKEILHGMLCANLICFQTYSYTRHFTSYLCPRV